jgi:hypothetical protein
MPIDLGSSIKKTSQWAFESSFLNSVLGSSLFVGLVIAFIMILLIMVMYPSKPGTPFSVLCKMFIYMFLSSMLVIFLHDGVIKYMYDEQNKDNFNEEFINGTESTERDPTYTQKSIQPIGNITGGYTYTQGNMSSNMSSNNMLSNSSSNMSNNILSNNTIRPNNTQKNTEPVLSIIEGGRDRLPISRLPPKPTNIFQ